MGSFSNRRIVVTGMGAVSPVGNSVSESWGNLLSGKSGIVRITQFDPSDLRCQLAGTVKNLDMTKYLPVRDINRMDAFCHFAIAASDEATAQAGITRDIPETRERVGVLVSSGIGAMNVTCQQNSRMENSGTDRVSPMTMPMIIPNMGSGVVGMRYNAKGPNFGLVSACASGLHSIGEAAWIIERGDADVMICGGTESAVVKLGICAFGAMRALSSAHNDEPEKASRPFDAKRDGFIPSEGAGVLILESLEHALSRGATPIAEIIGYGASCDAYHMTSPQPDGLGCATAIETAMRHAEIAPEEIDYINAHGTSTTMNDSCETKAIKHALKEHAYHVAISSTKSMTGHMLGAAGGFESVVCLKAIQEGLIPPTINLENPDPECDLDYVPNQARQKDVRIALNISLGFGGHNAAVLFKRYES